MKFMFSFATLVIISNVQFFSLRGVLAQIINSGGLTTDNDDAVTFGAEECKNCTKYIDDNIQLLEGALSRLDNGVNAVKFMPPCDTCYFYNVGNFSSYGDSCVTPVPNQPNVWNTKLNLRWENLTMKCVCKLSADLSTLMETFDTQVNLGSTGCDAAGTSIDLGGVSEAIMNVFKPDLTKLLSPSCISLGLSTTHEVTFGMSWFNITYRLNIHQNRTVKGPKSVIHVDGHAIDRNFNNIHTNCEVDSSKNNLCNCVMQANVVNTVMEQAAEFIVGCNLAANHPEVQFTFASFAVCDK